MKWKILRALFFIVLFFLLLAAIMPWDFFVDEHYRPPEQSSLGKIFSIS